MQLHWILHNLAASVMHNAAVVKCVVSLLVRLPQYIMHNNAAVVMQALWVKITLRDHPRLEAPAIRGWLLQDTWVPFLKPNRRKLLNISKNISLKIRSKKPKKLSQTFKNAHYKISRLKGPKYP